MPSDPDRSPPLRGRDDGRLLVLFDGDCGFCLHGRDLLRQWDLRDRLADDVIQRHAASTLADLTEDDQLASWHVVHPDGRRESGGAALAAVLERLPLGSLPARVLRAAPGPTEHAYAWVSAHRDAISRLLRTREHPQRGRWRPGRGGW